MGDRSVDARDISRSVVVTGDRNKVTLTFGATGIALPLRRKQFPSPERRHRPRTGEPPRELDLLVAEAKMRTAFLEWIDARFHPGEPVTDHVDHGQSTGHAGI